MGGYFLVLEGLDGSGKSEVSRRLAAHMEAALPERVMLTFEPYNPSAAGTYIRQVLKKEISVTSYTLALAYALNRADHLQQVVNPFLDGDDDQRVVVCDRYYLSSLVYQSVGINRNNVMRLNKEARTPNLTLFLDASADTCYTRLGTRGQKRELFDSNLNETREKYFRSIAYLQARGETIVTVNANSDLLTVLNEVIDVMNAHAPSWLRLVPMDELAPQKPTTHLRPAMEVFEKHFLHKPSIQWE